MSSVRNLRAVFRKFTHQYIRLEIEVDLQENAAARNAIKLAKSTASSMTFSFAFVIEGHNEDELPEQLLASFGVHKAEMKGIQAADALETEDSPTTEVLS